MPRPTSKLTHLDAAGNVRMVDVTGKRTTTRTATARAIVVLPAPALAVLLAGGDTKKGNVLQIARIAGIQAAKRTAELIPLCHQIPLTGVTVDLRLDGNQLVIEGSATCRGQTGVEMEALTAVSVAALTVYDMLKAVSHDLVITGIELLTKDGGRSGRIDRRRSTLKRNP
jgi:molybdenum cofactor biosynthesis protein MoaC